MFHDDSERVEAIERRLIDALNSEQAQPLDVITAIHNVLTLTLAMIACPDCRKLVAEQLATYVPTMLAHAKDIAADAAKDGLASSELPRHLH